MDILITAILPLNLNLKIMALYNYLNRIERLDSLIRHKCTGTPKELAKKLDISERWLYIFLDELKTDLGCPIRYDRKRRSYVYDEPGKVTIGFIKDVDNYKLKNIIGGCRHNFPHSNHLPLFHPNNHQISVVSG